MPVTSSKVKELYDAASAVVLRGTAAAAITSDTTGTGVSLSQLDEAYWQNGEIPHGVFEVCVNVTEANAGSVGTIISLFADDTSDMSDTPTTIDSFTLPASGNGFFRRYVDSQALAVLDAETSGADKWLALNVNVPGSGSPSLKVACWIGRFIAH